jgi:flagellar biosynthesis protein FliP
MRLLAPLLLLLASGPSWAQALEPDVIGQTLSDTAGGIATAPVATSVRLIVVLTAMTFVPAALMVMTPFTRFTIVFALLRQALGLQQTPPNQVLVGLSLFLSMLVMQPTIDRVKMEAADPFMAGQIETTEALTRAAVPMRAFMMEHVRTNDLEAVMQMGRLSAVESVDEVPTSAIASAFVLSELKTAFVIGVKVYIPFLVIDLVVANILLGMGMMVLPPVVISLPLKLLIFVLMDGWNLLIRSMAAGFGA